MLLDASKSFSEEMKDYLDFSVPLLEKNVETYLVYVYTGDGESGIQILIEKFSEIR